MFNDYMNKSADDETGINAPQLLLPCDKVDSGISLGFVLTDETEGAGSSVEIDVPLRELAVPLVSVTNNSTQISEVAGRLGVNASNACVIKVSKSSEVDSDDLILLGDAFFRSAYTYNNLDQNTISIAKPVFNSTAENIIPIGKGPVPKLFGTG